MPSFIDLEEVVRQWAWKKFDETATRKQKSLRDKELRKKERYIGVEIDWSELDVKERTTWSQLSDADGQSGSQSIQNGPAQTALAAADDNKLQNVSPLKPSPGTPTSTNVLFQTEFTNNTHTPQTYTMRVDKTTQSTCATEIEHGVCKGFDLSVSLKMPGEIVEANAGYHREVSLTRTEGETLEEELSWGAESEIRVDSRHMAHAQLLVREKKKSGDFLVESKYRGMVHVTFTRLRENNSLLKSVSGDIAFIMNKYKEQKARIGAMFDFVTVLEDDTVLIKTKGCCKFCFGVKQEVKVDQIAI